MARATTTLTIAPPNTMNPATFSLLTAAVLAARVHAVPRASADYRIPADATDAGGERTASVSYSNDGSAGGITGTSAVAANTMKGGYIGQLYEATGLTLDSPASTVNETASIPLAASLSLDDATTLAVPATSMLWSVLDGPLSISAGGLATAGAVYQNTGASLQGSHAGLTGILDLTVIELFPDNFGIYAGDGLPDDWQVFHFGPDNPAAAPSGDPDQDGFDNRFEFTAGTGPSDPHSVFRLRMEPAPGVPGHTRIIFSPRLFDRTYTVKSSTNLLSDEWIALSSAFITDSRDERTVTDQDTSATRKYYRVDITKP